MTLNSTCSQPSMITHCCSSKTSVINVSSAVSLMSEFSLQFQEPECWPPEVLLLTRTFCRLVLLITISCFYKLSFWLFLSPTNGLFITPVFQRRYCVVWIKTREHTHTVVDYSMCAVLRSRREANTIWLPCLLQGHTAVFEALWFAINVRRPRLTSLHTLGPVCALMAPLLCSAQHTPCIYNVLPLKQDTWLQSLHYFCVGVVGGTLSFNDIDMMQYWKWSH